VLELPQQTQMLRWRVVAPTMADQLEGPGHGLNRLSREALAVATLLSVGVGNERIRVERFGPTR
jgi:hypothetical protein